ncbi:MAG: hypothetical protein J2P37_16400, partial [Ktedonobacteraceae bacterium]|nr:hypothetical protein [Ktedonobacteraceae bacterium]
EQALHQLVGYSDTYVVHLQQAGLIRPDLPVPIITYLMAILKVGMIAAPDLLGQEYLPPMEQVGGALSDLLHRWLSPAQLPPDTTTGKQFLSDWLDNVLEMGEHHEH